MKGRPLRISFCGSCGRTILHDFEFCPYCGSVVRRGAYARTPSGDSADPARSEPPAPVGRPGDRREREGLVLLDRLIRDLDELDAEMAEWEGIRQSGWPGLAGLGE